MNRSIIFTPVLVLTSLSTVGSLGSETTASTEPAPKLNLSAAAYGIDQSGIEGSKAEYAVSGTEIELNWAHWQIALGRHHYQWDQPAEFPGMTGMRDPWEDFTRIRLGFSHNHQLSERWFIEVMAGAQSEFEDEIDDSWAGYLGAYGTYAGGEDWLWFIGALHSRHTEIASDFEWIPILGLSWRPQATEGLSVRFGLPITRMNWHFTPRTRLSLDLNTVEGGVYRLADDNPLQSGGYVEMINASLSLNLETQLSETFELSVGVGHSLHREWTLYNAQGREIDSADVDDAPSLHLSLKKFF